MFPHLAADEYSLKSTRNRGIEAIHCVFRGGSCALRITSPNLSFQEFLLKMIETLLIYQAEHNHSQAGYTKLEVYQEFIEQLTEACLLGDEDSKLPISELAPELSATLQQHNEWDSPSISVDPSPSSLSLVGSSDYPILARFATEDLTKLIYAVLGKAPILGNSEPIIQD